MWVRLYSTNLQQNNLLISSNSIIGNGMNSGSITTMTVMICFGAKPARTFNNQTSVVKINSSRAKQLFDIAISIRDLHQNHTCTCNNSFYWRNGVLLGIPNYLSYKTWILALQKWPMLLHLLRVHLEYKFIIHLCYFQPHYENKALCIAFIVVLCVTVLLCM